MTCLLPPEAAQRLAEWKLAHLGPADVLEDEPTAHVTLRYGLWPRVTGDEG